MYHTNAQHTHTIPMRLLLFLVVLILLASPALGGHASSRDRGRRSGQNQQAQQDNVQQQRRQQEQYKLDEEHRVHTEELRKAALEGSKFSVEDIKAVLEMEKLKHREKLDVLHHKLNRDLKYFNSHFDVIMEVSGLLFVVLAISIRLKRHFCIY